MSSDQIVTLALQLESSHFNRGLTHSQGLMRSLGEEGNALTATLKRTAAAMGSLIVGSKAVRALTSSIQAASAYREDLAQFDHVMRNVTKSANDMVASLTSDAYGRTNMQARQMLMGMTSLAKGMGMTDKAAVELSGEFSKMAIDIGSFMMVNPDNVMGAFQSALMGNTMALRTYNVHLNEAKLKETIAANAKKGMVFATERQARAHAVLTEVQRQQSDAIGDYAVESANFGNQLRQFHAGLSELPAKFGAGLLQPANEFLKCANRIIDTMRNMDESTWKTISTFIALGTAVSLAFGTYKVGTAAVGAYTIAKQAATGAIAGNNLALGSNTTALAANNAATVAGTVGGISQRSASLGTVARRTPSPFARQEAVLNIQAENLRTAHSRVNNEIAVAIAARDAASRHYTQTGDIRYLGHATQATDRLNRATRKRDHLEHNMVSLNAARDRNNTARRVARQQNSQSIARNMIRRSRYNRAQCCKKSQQYRPQSRPSKK